MNESKSKRMRHESRSVQDRALQVYERSLEEMFIGVGRFSCHSDFARVRSTEADSVVIDRKIRKKDKSKDDWSERRSGRERRCGADTRSEVDQFLQGERRSGLDRRAPLRYRSFKKARAFVRSLGLKSTGDWRDYVKSRTKPDDIPSAPHHIYANDGWAGWGDWLATGPSRRLV